jgi:hypothetical protein
VAILLNLECGIQPKDENLHPQTHGKGTFCYLFLRNKKMICENSQEQFFQALGKEQLVILSHCLIPTSSGPREISRYTNIK